jgi:hypothetical protein
MEIVDALNFLNNIMSDDNSWPPVKELCDLIITVYDKGWKEGITYYQNDSHLTDIKTRRFLQ